MKKEIDSFGRSCYRFILGIRRIDRIRNEDNTLYKRQVRSLGHWIRKDDIIAQYALYQCNTGKNRRGRPQLTYCKHIENISDSTVAELQRKALNRDESRRDVVRRFDLHPPG